MVQYTPAQAAAVTGLSLAAIHKAIDSRLIRSHPARTEAGVRRVLTKEQVIFLQLEAEGLRLLPPGTRRGIAESIQRSPRTDRLPVETCSALSIEVGPARRKVERGLKNLARIEQMVASDAGVMRGAPVFKGTRIPVGAIADMVAQGASVEEILAGYPALDREKIGIAPLYVRAFPRRGRPSRKPWQGQRARGKRSYQLSDLPAPA